MQSIRRIRARSYSMDRPPDIKRSEPIPLGDPQAAISQLNHDKEVSQKLKFMMNHRRESFDRLKIKVAKGF